MASHGPNCKRRCKRKENSDNGRNQIMENNENREPIVDFIDLTGDSPVRPIPKRKHQDLVADTTIDLEDSNNSTNSSIKKPETGIVICPICYENLTVSVRPMSTKCGHIFCYTCLISALKIRRRCPKCQKNITERTCTRLYFDHN